MEMEEPVDLHGVNLVKDLVSLDIVEVLLLGHASEFLRIGDHNLFDTAPGILLLLLFLCLSALPFRFFGRAVSLLGGLHGLAEGVALLTATVLFLQ